MDEGVCVCVCVCVCERERERERDREREKGREREIQCIYAIVNCFWVVQPDNGVGIKTNASGSLSRKLMLT
jgi:hypothetical protein